MRDAVKAYQNLRQNEPASADGTPTARLDPLELRERYDEYGLRLVALYRIDGGKRMSNWVRA